MHSGLLIFLGGGFGALARWLLSSAVQSVAEDTALHRLPWGIAACNLAGCFAIGAVFGVFASRVAPDWLFPLLVTGFLGGFTTFSAFGNDTRILLSEGLPGSAILNILVSTIGGIVLVLVGYRAGQAFAS